MCQITKKVILMIQDDCDGIVNWELINENTSFKNDLKMGLEHFQDIISCTQETFGVELLELDLDDIETVKDLINLIKKYAKEQEIDLRR